MGDPPGARGPALRREPPAAAAAGARRRPPPGPRPLTPRSRGCPPAPSRACPSRLAPRPAGGRHRAGAWLHRSARLALPLALGLRRPAAPPALYFRGRGVTSRPRPPPGQPIPAASPLKGRCQAAEALAWGPPRRGACGDAALVFRGQRGGALGTPAALRARGACGFPRSARAARSCLPQGGAAPRGDLPVFCSRGDGFCVFSPARGPQRGRTSEGRCGVAADKGGGRRTVHGGSGVTRDNEPQRGRARGGAGPRGAAEGAEAALLTPLLGEPRESASHLTSDHGFESQLVAVDPARATHELPRSPGRVSLSDPRWPPIPRPGWRPLMPEDAAPASLSRGAGDAT